VHGAVYRADVAKKDERGAGESPAFAGTLQVDGYVGDGRSRVEAGECQLLPVLAVVDSLPHPHTPSLLAINGGSANLDSCISTTTTPGTTSGSGTTLIGRVMPTAR
jgi:hypothetical protein